MIHLLLVLSLLGNALWILNKLYRWWRAAPRTHHHVAIATVVVYVGAWLVVHTAAGSLAAWMLGLASIGLPVTVAGALTIVGYSAAHHAKREAAAITAIEADRRRELVR